MKIENSNLHATDLKNLKFASTKRDFYPISQEKTTVLKSNIECEDQ